MVPWVVLGVIVRESGRSLFREAGDSHQPHRVLDAPLSKALTRGFSAIPGRSQRERTRNLEIPDQSAFAVRPE
jgi:hypothetical protein